MPSYVLEFDLQGSDALSDEYRDLANELFRLNGHRVTAANWLVDVLQKADALEKHVSTYLKPGHSVRASALTKDHRFCQMSGDTGAWVARHPPIR